MSDTGVGPIKPWWPGDARVEKYMPRVSQAIERHIPRPSPEYTDIYNRAYEAVYEAIRDMEKQASIANVLAKPRGEKWNGVSPLVVGGDKGANILLPVNSK